MRCGDVVALNDPALASGENNMAGRNMRGAAVCGGGAAMCGGGTAVRACDPCTAHSALCQVMVTAILATSFPNCAHLPAEL